MKNTPKTPKSKMDYLDVLMTNSRFSELRFKPEFTEFVLRDFIGKAAAKCIEIKSKYKRFGKPIAPKKLVEICFAENIHIDVEPENHQGYTESWLAKTDEGGIIWIGDIDKEHGQQLLFHAFAVLSLPEAAEVIINSKTPYTTLEDLVEDGELFRAVLLTETLFALLQSSETKTELVALLDPEPEPEPEPEPFKPYVIPYDMSQIARDVRDEKISISRMQSTSYESVGIFDNDIIIIQPNKEINSSRLSGWYVPKTAKYWLGFGSEESDCIAVSFPDDNQPVRYKKENVEQTGAVVGIIRRYGTAALPTQDVEKPTKSEIIAKISADTYLTKHLPNTIAIQAQSERNTRAGIKKGYFVIIEDVPVEEGDFVAVYGKYQYWGIYSESSGQIKLQNANLENPYEIFKPSDITILGKVIGYGKTATSKKLWHLKNLHTKIAEMETVQ